MLEARSGRAQGTEWRFTVHSRLNIVGRMSASASSVMRISCAAGPGSAKVDAWTTMSSTVLYSARADFGCYSLVTQLDERLKNCRSAAEAFTLVTDSARVLSLADNLAGLAQDWTNLANARASAVFELLAAVGLPAIGQLDPLTDV